MVRVFYVYSLISLEAAGCHSFGTRFFNLHKICIFSYAQSLFHIKATLYNHVCSASKSKKKNESCWVVGLDSSKLFCIICKSPEKFPQARIVCYANLFLENNIVLFLIQAIPKQALTLLDLSIPLASSDLGAQNLESEFIIRNMHLSQVIENVL